MILNVKSLDAIKKTVEKIRTRACIRLSVRARVCVLHDDKSLVRRIFFVQIIQ